MKVGIGKDKKDRNAKQAEYSLGKENPGARNLYTVTWKLAGEQTSRVKMEIYLITAAEGNLEIPV